MPDQPLVSVLTAAYNGQNFLPQTIESICSQTFQNFEYILIDDASTDRTPQILAHYAGQDKRIQVLRNAAKRGPAASLNQGLDRARGVYVANLDHDDVALPQRLHKQVAFLDSQAHVGVVGTWARLIDSQDRQLGLFAGPTQPARDPLAAAHDKSAHPFIGADAASRGPTHWGLCGQSSLCLRLRSFFSAEF